jgi:hypothetical protein
MTTPSAPSRLFPTETDPEHILGQGFKITFSTTELALTEDDASTPCPVVLRSVWGKAVRTARAAWPYDFHPLLYSGAQLWAGRSLLVPPQIGLIGSGRGRWC